MLIVLQDLLLRLARVPPAPGMTIDNVYAYLDALHDRRDVEGPVVELGCARGGTTVLACRLLSRLGCEKEYFCIDTFGGFVREHLEVDHRDGLTRDHDGKFRNNSKRRVARTLARNGIRERVHLVQGDICELDDGQLPDGISVALVDVDLRVPVREGLARLYPRLAPGGLIVVDDCKQATSWVGADLGYRDFIAEHGLEPKYFAGFAVVENLDDGRPGIPWELSSSPNEIVENSFFA